MAGRRRYHFHPPFLLYAGVTVLLGVGAVNSQNNLLFFAFGAALGALLISGVVSGGMLMGIEAQRRIVERGRVGEPFTFGYAVRNRSRWRPAFGLQIEEMRSRADDGPVDITPAFLSYVPRRSARHARARLTPARRGRLQLRGVKIISGFPFGIVRKSVNFEQPASVIIHPRRLEGVDRVLIQLSGLGGDSSTMRRVAGRQPDFQGLREYAAGDSLRQIAWRATARSGELIVREQAAGGATRIWVALDLSGGAESSRAEDENERAIALAGTLMEQAASSGAPIGLVIPATGLERSPRPSSADGAWIRALLDDLALLDLDAPGLSLERTAPARPGAMVVVHARAASRHTGPAGAQHVVAESTGDPTTPAGAAPAEGAAA